LLEHFFLLLPMLNGGKNRRHTIGSLLEQNEFLGVECAVYLVKTVDQVYQLFEIAS